MDRLLLTRQLKAHVRTQMYDVSEAEPSSCAIYLLSDPRDLAAVRYVGQTNAPRRRFLQHLNQARLWLPEERPWWVKSPQLRPLYTWIRELHQDECRLPTMVISAWAHDTREARTLERASIMAHLQHGMQLLNVETEILGPQLPLL